MAGTSSYSPETRYTLSMPPEGRGWETGEKGRGVEKAELVEGAGGGALRLRLRGRRRKITAPPGTLTSPNPKH